jgi:hypothetical protein
MLKEPTSKKKVVKVIEGDDSTYNYNKNIRPATLDEAF